MKLFRYFLIVILLTTLALPDFAQDNTVVLQRTPEQEATKQTEKLQQELNLNQEQTKQIYEINLKYARQRQVSNSRSAAMERMKNKNTDIEKILNEEQNYKLQTKRYERTTTENPTVNRNLPANSSGFRSSSEHRTNPTFRTPGNDNILRNNYRSTAPENNSRSTDNNTYRRSTTTPSRTPQLQNNQPTTRPSDNSYSAPRSSQPQTQTPSRPPSVAPSRQSTPTTGGSRKTEPSSTNNRR